MIRFNTDKVRKHYTRLGVSGDHFAYDADVKRGTFGAIMAGEANPRLETAYKIAKQMNCKVDDLLIIEKQ